MVIYRIAQTSEIILPHFSKIFISCAIVNTVDIFVATAITHAL